VLETNQGNIMRVIKTTAKQMELAAQGKLFIIANCAYVAVSPEHVAMAQGTGQKFYARMK
jgi:hypothetical protein